MKSFTIVSLLLVAAILLAACGGAKSSANDLLAKIKERGTLVVSTDPNYEPQSFLNTKGKRPAETKCSSDQLSSAEMQGFDVDVAVEIGKRLGVETCFATPAWDLITAGNWADKWDISVGSMTITKEREKILQFTVPYYYYNAVVGVLADSTITSLADLAGKAVCVGASTTYDKWASGGDLGFPESNIFATPPANLTVVPLETDQECAQALVSGRKDFVAYITADTVVDSNIANGLPVKKLGQPLFTEQLAVAVDKSHTLSIDSLVTELNKIVTAMHDDGTLSTLSVKWYKVDLSKAPSK